LSIVAVGLSGTGGGSIFYYREELGTFELGETTGLNQEVVTKSRKLDILARDTGLGEAIGKRTQAGRISTSRCQPDAVL
jgi:hypothetical protein